MIHHGQEVRGRDDSSWLLWTGVKKAVKLMTCVNEFFQYSVILWARFLIWSERGTCSE